ncbi:hypothetical protein [Paenibacillus aestuarii]|uniref:Uncharacterized protein n=1 Tax=Paenibacillus aestuarii TaxID=516965 RepID=A0ABW0K768_9BACL|nr:hypothetical protein [Paenibacillus aestuarii]
MLVTCKQDVIITTEIGTLTAFYCDEEYLAHLDADGVIIAIDEASERHTISRSGADDAWFQAHFAIVELDGGSSVRG